MMAVAALVEVIKTSFGIIKRTIPYTRPFFRGNIENQEGVQGGEDVWVGSTCYCYNNLLGRTVEISS